MKAIEDITNFIFLQDELEKADIIFIPGGSYSELGEEAAKLWKNKYAPLVLPSGRFGIKKGSFSGPASKAYIYQNSYGTEWEFLKAVLIENGVEERAILREDKAQYTYENAFNSKKITDSLDLSIDKAIICCKSFHARRCFMYYQWAYPNTKLLIYPCDIENIERDNWFKTENGIEKVMGEIKRIGEQFKDYCWPS